MALNKQAKKRLIVLAEMISTLYQGEIGLLVHNERTKEFIWNTGYSQGHLLVLLRPVIKVNRR